MVVFGVMLVQRTDMEESNLANWRFMFAALLGGGMFMLIGIFAARSQWTVTGTEVPYQTVEALAPILLNDFVIPFEVAAILLTVTLTGALLIVKEVKANGDGS